MLKTKSIHNFFLDLALLTLFVLSTVSGVVLWLFLHNDTLITFLSLRQDFWLALHLWGNLIGLIGIILHIVWHRRWLKVLKGRAISSLPAKLKKNRLLDRIVWIAYLLAAVSGVFVWGKFFDALVSKGALRLHVVFGCVWSFCIVIHLVFHAGWIRAVLVHFSQAENPPQSCQKIS